MKKLFLILLPIILFIAFCLRMVNFDDFHNIQQDEEVWIVSGYTLLTKGVPQSWTVFWDTYGDYHEELLGGIPYVVVEPYLDHPPLFSILIGGWTYLTTGIDYIFSNWAVIRLPMLLISIVTIIVTAYLVTELFGERQGVFTLVAFSFLPSHIITSKVIAAESLLALMLMLSLLLLALIKSNTTPKRQSIYLTVLFILSLLSVLTKLSGILIPLTVIILFLSEKKMSQAFLMFLALMLGVLIYFLYGSYYDINLFLSILAAHGLRPQTFWYFFTIFEQPDLGYYQVHDPLMIVGIIGSLMMAFLPRSVTYLHPNRNLFLIVPWILLSFIFMNLAPIELYAWYKYLLFPLAAIGIGWIWDEFYKGNVGWIVLLIPTLLVLCENIFLFSPDFNLYRRVLSFVLFSISIFFLLKHNRAKSKYYTVFSLTIICIVALLAMIWSVTIG